MSFSDGADFCALAALLISLLVTAPLDLLTRTAFRLPSRSLTVRVRVPLVLPLMQTIVTSWPAFRATAPFMAMLTNIWPGYANALGRTLM